MDNGLNVITGAGGHLGYAMLKELTSRGEKVRILIRKDSGIFDGIECEKFFGDVRDINSLAAAFAGAQTVYHFAGLIDVNTGQEELIRNVNYGGTKNVVEACKKCGVKRLVYASSVDALPPLANNVTMREPAAYFPDVLEGTYAKTKAAATRHILDECRQSGFDAVIILPSACIGPYDYKVSSVGALVRMIIRGAFPVTMSFGRYNFVDVRDVARGAYMAAEKGRRGECYILDGEVLSVGEVIKILSEKAGRKTTRLSLSYRFVKGISPLMEIYYKATGQTPLLTRYSVRKLVSNCNFSHQKAADELDFHPMPAKQSLCDMVDWILDSGC